MASKNPHNDYPLTNQEHSFEKFSVISISLDCSQEELGNVKGNILKVQKCTNNEVEKLIGRAIINVLCPTGFLTIDPLQW